MDVNLGRPRAGLGLEIVLFPDDVEILREKLQLEDISDDGRKFTFYLAEDIEPSPLEEPGFHIEANKGVPLRLASDIKVYLSPERLDELTTNADFHGETFMSRSNYDRIHIHYLP